MMKPTFLRHMMRNGVLEDDNIFLHVQEHELAVRLGGHEHSPQATPGQPSEQAVGKGAWAKAYYLATTGDVLVFRTSQSDVSAARNTSTRGHYDSINVLISRYMCVYTYRHTYIYTYTYIHIHTSTSTSTPKPTSTYVQSTHKYNILIQRTRRWYSGGAGWIARVPCRGRRGRLSGTTPCCRRIGNVCSIARRDTSHTVPSVKRPRRGSGCCGRRWRLRPWRRFFSLCRCWMP